MNDTLNHHSNAELGGRARLVGSSALLSRGALALGVLTAAFASPVFVPAAQALQSCTGIYEGAALDTIPTPNVVQYDVGAETQTATAIANRFLAGMQAAGVVFSGQPTTQLNVTAAVTPPTGANGGTPPAPGTYTGFGWAAQSGAGAASIIGASLSMSFTLTNIQTASLDWSGDVSCIIQTDDRGLLAEQIGQVIGRALGQNFIKRNL